MIKRIINYLKSNQVDCFTLSHSTNKLAFTLAETLIVMGIIGVVAALTLPNLNSSTGEKEKVTKVKKIYQNLNDAFGRAEAVYGPFDEWCNNYSGSCNHRRFERILEFLKVSKKCDSVTSCTMSLDLFGTDGSSYNDAAILADGTEIIFSSGHFDGKAYFGVDIDGPNKGKNKGGYDTFCFYCKSKGGIIVYEDMMSNSSSYVPKMDNGFQAISAAVWIVNFDNMDYLKTTDGTTCPDGKTKLTFGGNHSCK